MYKNDSWLLSLRRGDETNGESDLVGEWKELKVTSEDRLTPHKRNRHSCAFIHPTNDSVGDDKLRFLLFGGNFYKPKASDLFMDDWRLATIDVHNSTVQWSYALPAATASSFSRKLDARGHHTFCPVSKRNEFLLFGGEQRRKRYDDLWTVSFVL